MEWISVNNVKPETLTSVLVFVTNGNDFSEITVGNYDADEKLWYTEASSCEKGDAVTHWMPLPEKPRNP